MKYCAGLLVLVPLLVVGCGSAEVEEPASATVATPKPVVVVATATPAIIIVTPTPVIVVATATPTGAAPSVVATALPASTPAASVVNAADDSVASIQTYGSHVNAIFSIYDEAMKVVSPSEVKNNSSLEASVSKLQSALDMVNNNTQVPPSCAGLKSRLAAGLSVSMRGLRELQTANNTQIKENYDIAAKSVEEGSKGMSASLRESADLLESAVRRTPR